MKTIFGTLYIVATPLGNLEDITFRAIKILKQVDLIAAEDTRHSKKLLSHYDITTKLVSFHEHNEAGRTLQIITQLKNGLNIALISDAGTPSISDPGYKLVASAADQKINVIPIPGCSAAIAGLSVSGLPTDSFIFFGFLPKKEQKQRQAIEAIKNKTPTLIFYESPKRIKALIKNMITIWGDRQACLAREITKIHEEYIRASLSDILRQLEKRNTIKGECSLFVHGCLKEKTINNQELEKIVQNELKSSSLGTSALAGQIAKQYNLPRKQIYQMILDLSNSNVPS